METAMLHGVRETKIWAMELVIGENADETEATARLHVGDVELAGSGRARRNPQDPARPRVGEELAVARALSDLSNVLTDAAAREIAEFEATAGKSAEPTERPDSGLFEGPARAGDRGSDPPRAGWYPDPEDRYEQRYFDGEAWTDQTRTAGPLQSPS
jgi:hypothetical protein